MRRATLPEYDGAEAPRSVSAADFAISKSQLDKLGSRLRNSNDPDDADLVLLNRYREKFGAVNEAVLEDLEQLTHFTIETRHKSVPSIVAKLRRRQPSRLSAIQDLAGARIIVPGLRAQNDLVEKIIARRPQANVDDKRSKPTFGYRAVHIIVNAPLPYEIQVRTDVQHAWAQLSERLADRYGFELKYGGGPQNIARALADYSDFGADLDRYADSSGVFGDDLTGIVQGYLEQLPAIVEALKIE